MFDFNPFREFKEMMKQRRLQENEYYGIDATGTDPTTGSGLPTQRRTDSIDTNMDNGEEWRRRVDEIGQQTGNTPKPDEKARRRRKRLRDYATRASEETYRLNDEAEAKKQGITVEKLHANRQQEEDEWRDRIYEYGT